MALGKGLTGFRVSAALFGALIIGAPATASAHALFVKPVPRDTTDDKLKFGPCGGTAANNLLAKGQPVEQYQQGATITVDFKETVAHSGCYVFEIANGDEKVAANWTRLKQVDDPAGSQANQQTTLQLPAGLSCMNCTLRMIQVMLPNNAICPQNQSYAATSNYYSCADVRVGTFTDAGAIMDAGQPNYDASSQDEPGSSGGPTTTPTDGGGNVKDDEDDNGAGPGSRNLQAGKGDDCSIGFGATTGVSFFVTAGIAAMALLRRRKKS